MSLDQLTGKQMDLYERVWTRVMLASGATSIIALFGVYFFSSGGTEVLVCGILVAVSVIVGFIAAVKLRELERGLNGSDREARGDVHSALGGLDD